MLVTYYNHKVKSELFNFMFFMDQFNQGFHSIKLTSMMTALFLQFGLSDAEGQSAYYIWCRRLQRHIITTVLRRVLGHVTFPICDIILKVWPPLSPPTFSQILSSFIRPPCQVNFPNLLNYSKQKNLQLHLKIHIVILFNKKGTKPTCHIHQVA